MFKQIYNKINAKESSTEMAFLNYQAKIQKLDNLLAKLWGKQESQNIAGGNAKWNNPNGREFGNVQQKYICITLWSYYPKYIPAKMQTE